MYLPLYYVKRGNAMSEVNKRGRGEAGIHLGIFSDAIHVDLLGARW